MLFQISPKKVWSHWRTRMIRNWKKSITRRNLLENEFDQSGDDWIENHINDIIQNNQPLHKKLVENSQNSQIPGEIPGITISGWEKLPDKIIEKILIQAIESSDNVCETYNNIMNTCFRFQIIGKKGKM